MLSSFFLFLSLRSRRKHKAWGASPRIDNGNCHRAREAGGSAVAHFMGWKNFAYRDPGACAPGFILSPASRAVRGSAFIA